MNQKFTNIKVNPIVAGIIVGILLIGAGSLAYFSRADGITKYPVDAIHEELGDTKVKVMTFNIWIGGSVVDFGKVIQAIKSSGADVVGLQESDGNAARVANLLGWPFVNESLQIISKYPLIQPGDSEGLYTYVQLAPGQVFAMSNIHLPSDPYGPYQIVDGMSKEDVLKSEEATRMPTLNQFLPTWKKLLAQEMPLVITGDFNSPSHLDWIDKTVNQRKAMKFPVAWPESKAVADLGMIDTYRVVNPDPKKVPGVTWTLGYPYPRIAKDETVDRIDFIFVPAGTKVISSDIVGPKGGPDVTIGITPYPSDHLAVVSAFKIKPVEPPAYIATNKLRYEQGDSLGINYHAPLGDEDVIALVTAGTDPLTDSLVTSPPQEAGYFGALTFGTQTLDPGKYEVALISAGKAIKRSAFWVITKNAIPTISSDKAIYSQGEPIRATWKNTYARKFDWIGISTLNDPAIYYAELVFIYTKSTVNGEYVITSDDLGGKLPVGQYELRYMSDDSYVVSAAQKFTVVN